MSPPAGPLHLVGLTELMQRTRGNPSVAVGLIDGPVAIKHPQLEGRLIREVPNKFGGYCSQADSAACTHGTLVAGILFSERGSAVPGICPDCTLLVRAIFDERPKVSGYSPSASPRELAEAIVETVNSGARVLNISSALAVPSTTDEPRLQEALDYAARRGVLTVVAAGNQGTVGGSAITSHPWVIPVSACNLQGWPMHESNLGRSIGTRGLMAPGDGVSSLGINGTLQRFGEPALRRRL